MEKPDWDASLAVGNKAMDMEHRIQVSLVQAMEEAIRSSDRDGHLRQVVTQLYDYTSAHFLAENLLMRLQAYPEYEAHSADHDRFVALLEELVRTVEEGEPRLSLETTGSLRSWLSVHIQGMDRRLSSFVAERATPALRRA